MPTPHARAGGPVAEPEQPKMRINLGLLEANLLFVFDEFIHKKRLVDRTNALRRLIIREAKKDPDLKSMLTAAQLDEDDTNF